LKVKIEVNKLPWSWRQQAPPKQW